MDATDDATQPSVRYRRPPGFVHRAVRGWVYLRGPGGVERRLGGPAAAVWRALDVPRSLAELAVHLADEGDGAAGEAGIAAALEALVEAELVRTERDEVAGTASPATGSDGSAAHRSAS